MSDNQVLKADRDYSPEVNAALPEAQKTAKGGSLQAGIDQLLALEKKTRQASDLPSTQRLLVGVAQLCKEAGDWALLSEQVTLLSKKHGQLKQAVTVLVQEVMGYLDHTPSMNIKLDLIETLRTVTEGKLFVEVERARVTRILSDIKRNQGDIPAAKDVLCELQVETFGSMSRREKTEFILQQVELCIEDKDWTQAAILGRKVSTRYFQRKTTEQKPKDEKEKEAKKANEATAPGEKDDDTAGEDDVTDLKLKYYEQRITLAKHDDRYLDACKDYHAVLDTEAVENNPTQLKATLQRVVFFILLAPFDNEQSDLLQRIARDSRLSQVPTEQEMVKLFTTAELMRWPLFKEQYGQHLLATDLFSDSETKDTPTDPEGKAFARWEHLRRRVIEHNVRVVAKYYTRIELPRLTELLDLADADTERYISDLVTSKTIYAKIDRPAKVVSFKKPADADDVLNEWSGNMKSLLGHLERIDHLIGKEMSMARIRPAMEKLGS